MRANRRALGQFDRCNAGLSSKVGKTTGLRGGQRAGGGRERMGGRQAGGTRLPTASLCSAAQVLGAAQAGASRAHGARRSRPQSRSRPAQPLRTSAQRMHARQAKHSSRRPSDCETLCALQRWTARTRNQQTTCTGCSPQAGTARLPAGPSAVLGVEENKLVGHEDAPAMNGSKGKPAKADSTDRVQPAA